MASTCLIYLGCWYLGRREAILSGRLSVSVVFSTNSTIASPNPGCGIAVIAKVTEIIERRVSSIDSICTFIPPVLMVLSFLPRMVKVPSGCISARSFVTKVSSQTCGAWITSVFRAINIVLQMKKVYMLMKHPDRLVCGGRYATRFLSFHR